MRARNFRMPPGDVRPSLARRVERRVERMGIFYVWGGWGGVVCLGTEVEWWRMEGASGN